MTQIVSFLPYIQIILSIIMVALILMQNSSAGAGGAFGGGESFNGPSHTKRGAEKTIFITTIVVGILFAASAFVALIVK